MAGLILSKHPQIEITIFYQDIQTFGNDFQQTYDRLKQNLKMTRSIPGDIFAQPESRLKVNYFDPQTKTGVEELFDLVVLSIGMTPRPDTADLARQLGLRDDFSDYTSSNARQRQSNCNDGIFIAGTARSPMNIPETIRHATLTARQVARYLER
jgi:heterodisulfide reductase subunit A